MNKDKLPSNLSMETSIVPTQALMFQSDSIDIDDKDCKSLIPILITEVTHNAPKKYSEKENFGGNLQRMDTAKVDNDKRYLHVKFNLSFFPKNTLNTCNKQEFHHEFDKLLKTYRENGTIEKIVREFLLPNLRKGLFLHRNIDSTPEMKVRIFSKNTKTQEFISVDGGIFNDNDELVEIITDVLCCKSKTRTDLTVIGSCNVGEGAIVYPSQEFNNSKGDDKDKPRVGDKNKFLVGDVNTSYVRGKKDIDGNPLRHAGLTSQKIGNGIRTFDTFYSDDEDVKPLPISPSGNDRSSMVWRRTNKKLAIDAEFDKMLHYIDEINNNYDNIDERIHLYIASSIILGFVNTISKEK